MGFDANKKFEHAVENILTQRQSQVDSWIESTTTIIKDIARQQESQMAKALEYTRPNIYDIIPATNLFQNNITIAMEAFSNISMPNFTAAQRFTQEQNSILSQMRIAAQSFAVETTQFDQLAAINALPGIDKAAPRTFEKHSFASLAATIGNGYFDNKTSVSNFENFINQMQEEKSSVAEMAQFLSATTPLNIAMGALSGMDQAMFGILENHSFSSLAETISREYFDNRVSVLDFENFINQMQQEISEEEIRKQATQNPIFVLFLLMLAIFSQNFIEQSATDIADNINEGFIKPHIEEVADLAENDRYETMRLTSNVNLRERPTKESEAVDKLKTNQTIIVIAEKKNWYKVRYFYNNDKFVEGWIYKRYTTKIQK